MGEYNFAARMDGLSGNAIRDIFKLLAKPGIISFAGGMPGPESFHPDVVSQIVADIMAKDGTKLLQYGQTEGYMPLCEQTAGYVKSMGMEITAAHVLPTSGSQQGLDLLCKAFINPGDTILVEQPTFLGALHTMRTYQADIQSVPCDSDGIDLEELEEAIFRYSPKLIYLIPTFSNPTGITLSRERRRAVAELAAKYQIVVAEDDPYRDLRYDGEPLPPIRIFDTEGYVVYLGSYSKLVSPGLRVGYAIAAPEILRKMVIGKQAADVHTGLLNQAVVAEILRRGLLADWVSAAVTSYREKLAVMLDNLSTFPEDVTFTHPQGGLFVWVTLPEAVNTTKLLEKAIGQGVAYIPGTHFYPRGGHENTLRLNFSASGPEQIIKGLDILKDLLN